MIRIVTLNTNRYTYDIRDAAASSITVRELIDELERNYNEDDKIVFSNDNGYTYGYVTEDRLQEHTVKTREEEEFEEKMEELNDELINLKEEYEHVPVYEEDETMSEETYLEYRANLFKEYGITEEEYNKHYSK
jgi:hypothetical protein